MAPDQDANGDNLWKCYNGMLCVLIRIASAILMSTHNIQYHYKIIKFPSIFVFLSYRKNSVRTQK